MQRMSYEVCEQVYEATDPFRWAGPVDQRFKEVGRNQLIAFDVEKTLINF